ncbi:MAG TPA: amidohydrolase family protein, partial [Nocardioides sp.]
GEDRLQVLLTVPLPQGEAAASEMQHWEGHPVVAGVLICSHIRGAEIDDPSLEPFWDYVADRQTVVLVHPTAPVCSQGYEERGLSIAAGFMHEQSRALARLCLSPLIQNRPDAFERLVVSHLGGGIASLADRLDIYWERFIVPDDPKSPRPTQVLRTLHFDLALNSRPAMVAAIDAWGTDRLVLGTDHPHMPYGMPGVIEQVRGLGLDDDVTNALLRSNANRLLAPRNI